MTQSSGGAGRRRLLTGVAAVALVAVGVVVGLAVGGGDDGGDDVVATEDGTTSTTAAPPDPSSGDPSSSDGTTTTVESAGPVAITPEGRELLDLIDQGQSATYTASYRTVDSSSQLGTVQVEVWRDGDRVRQDALVQVEGREVQSSAFIDGDQVRVCQRGTLQDAWQCQDVPRDQAPDIDGRIRAAVGQLADTTSGGRDETIAGAAARCYDVIDENGDAVQLCVTASGVPARFIAGENSIELLSYADGVPDGIFDPPA